MILAFNAGSSSLKFAAYRGEDSTPGGGGDLLASGAIARVGEANPAGSAAVSDAVAEALLPPESGHSAAARLVLDWLEQRLAGERIHAVGHRVVHGGELHDHSLIDASVELVIEDAAILAPLHNPPALDVIRHTRQQLGAGVPMAAVFDTVFFADLDPPAMHYAIPWELAQRHGIRRVGFHGIAHGSMVARGALLLGRAPGDVSLITLQLGNGCSAALVRGGRAVDTTMGLTPLEGLMMGTRSGSVDPALVAFIVEREKLTASEVISVLNDESGLRGVSGVSSDMRDVTAAADAGDARAALAVDMFVYRVRKQIGAFIAAGGPVDAIVLGGGIGEHAPEIRRAVCADLAHLGIVLDADANQGHGGGSADIAAPESAIRVLVVAVDEMEAIAEITESLLS